MLQWFNKQENSGSLKDKKVRNQQNSPLSDSALSENDHEFLFNQLLDGVAHGWHLGRIIKFFNNLQPRSNPSHWIAWLEKFEQKIVYAADPSQRRVGAIMMRFGELTQSSNELQQLGGAFHRIGKKLLIGDTTELILEYDGLDRVVEENNQPTAELTENAGVSTPISEEDTVDRVNQILESSPRETAESIENSAVLATTPEEEVKEIQIEQSLEVIEEFLRSEEDLSLNEVISLTEQPTQSPDFVLEPEDSAENSKTTENKTQTNDSDSIESLEAFTDQLTILQATNSEADTSEVFELTERNEARSHTDERGLSFNDDTEMHSATFEEEAFSNPSLTGKSTDKSVEETPADSISEDKLGNLPLESEYFTEQPTQSPDFVLEPEDSVKDSQNIESENLGSLENFAPIMDEDSDSIESLDALTEQLTVLQDESPKPNLSSDTSDDEITLVASETEKPDPSTPLSVASFLEAAKALVPQQKNNSIPLTWEEFVVVLEQDETLARQVARHLQITSTNPQEIVKATVNRLNKHEATKLSPANIELVESWFNLGLKQASAEDFQGAIASWDKALKLNPNLSEAWHNRGSALGRLAKYEEAILSFNRAIDITPERYQAWNDRAHALYQVKKWEQAVESWDKAISIVSDNYQFWYNRGCALEQLQRFDESISSYEKTLEIKPDFQPARSRYINLVTERSSSSPN